MNARPGTYRYVTHPRVLDYFACGWMWAAELGPVHGRWSALLFWPCDCHCVEPVAQGGPGWGPK